MAAAYKSSSVDKSYTLRPAEESKVERPGFKISPLISTGDREVAAVCFDRSTVNFTCNFQA